ncbi:MAG: hypothetical protein NVSMB52_12660 [Chloroflexota bacterium]
MLKGNHHPTDLRVGSGVLENRWLRVEVCNLDGTFTVIDKKTGAEYERLNSYEDAGDAGDTYNYSAPLCDLVLRSTESARVHVSVENPGYTKATLRIDLDWRLPVRLSEDRLSRASTYVDTTISTRITLSSDSHFIDVSTEWENVSDDHRLRVLFPLGTEASVSYAYGQFDVLRRPARMANPGDGWPEPSDPSLPQTGWVAVQAGTRGLLIANRGLPEYETLGDDMGTLALTLLRSVGWLSREDILSRIGGAGPTTPVPDAQCRGPMTASYAIIPYTNDWLSSRAYCDAEDFLVPLFTSVTGVHSGDRPQHSSSVELIGEHTLVLSACKKAEDHDALILRFWNVGEEPTEALVRCARAPSRAVLVDLKEEPLDVAPVTIDKDGNMLLQAGYREMVTLALYFDGVNDARGPAQGGEERQWH